MHRPTPIFRTLFRPLALLLWLGAGSATAPSQAAIYTFEDAQGVTHFSDRSDDPRAHVFIADPEPSPASAMPHGLGGIGLSLRSVVPRYHREISEAARNYQVDAALVHAVIEVESGYNARAVSPKGALGLMQLMPDTARQFQVRNPFNVQDNIQGGVRLLRALLDQYHNQLELTLAAYNAGSGQVEKYGRTIPPFSETRQFVPAVLQRYARNQSSRLEKQ